MERERTTVAVLRAQQRSSDRFIRGPIPISLVAVAGRLRGDALLVLLAVRYRTDVSGELVVTLPPMTRAAFGISRRALSRALHELERAGLVRVTRASGLSARIALVPDGRPDS